MAETNVQPTLWTTGRIIATGVVVALAIESAGIRGGRWAYTAEMPIVPAFRLGVVPVLQMALVPPLSAWLALRPRRRRMEKARHGSGV